MRASKTMSISRIQMFEITAWKECIWVLNKMSTLRNERSVGEGEAEFETH